MIEGLNIKIRTQSNNDKPPSIRQQHLLTGNVISTSRCKDRIWVLFGRREVVNTAPFCRGLRRFTGDSDFSVRSGVTLGHKEQA